MLKNIALQCPFHKIFQEISQCMIQCVCVFDLFWQTNFNSSVLCLNIVFLYTAFGKMHLPHWNEWIFRISLLFFLYLSISFSPVGGNAFFSPFKWIGFWNQSSCSVILRQLCGYASLTQHTHSSIVSHTHLFFVEQSHSYFLAEMLL